MFVPAANTNPARKKTEMNQLPPLNHPRQSSMVLRSIQSNILPPGGTFVALDRNSGQEISFSANLPTTTMATANKCNIKNPVLTVNDYPSFKMKICGFNTLHKNSMTHMSDYFQSLYEPTFPAHSHILFLGINYMQVICIEVEATIMGEFICRLIPRLLETCSHPFVVELKEAANEWKQYMHKCFVVAKDNFESAARKISVVLKTRDTVLKEHAKLPELTLEFEFRRSYIGIKVIVCKLSHEKFLDVMIERFVQKNERKKDLPKHMLFEELSQTEGRVILPPSLSELYMLQLKGVKASEDRYTELLAFEEKCVLESSTLRDDQKGYFKVVCTETVELLQQQKIKCINVKTKTGKAGKIVKINVGVNTDLTHTDNYVSTHLKFESAIYQYKTLYTGIIINHLKHMKSVFANQHMLLSCIKNLKNKKNVQLEDKENSISKMQELEYSNSKNKLSRNEDMADTTQPIEELTVGVKLIECLNTFKEMLRKSEILTNNAKFNEATSEYNDVEHDNEDFPEIDDTEFNYADVSQTGNNSQQIQQEILEDIYNDETDEIKLMRSNEYGIDELNELDELLMHIKEHP